MTDKVLFITGASSGIGAETARRAVDAGWRVALFARSEDKLNTLAGEIGDGALALPGDVTDLKALTDAIAKTVAHFGQVDAVYANAGTGLDIPGVEDGDPEEWRSLIDINVTGVLLTLKAAYPELKKTKGHLILTGSVAGRVHISGSIYGASKWFVHGLAGNLAQDMREWGGRCTVIAPGMVDTPFFDTPKPDKLKPLDVANAVVYALNQPSHANVQEVVVMPTG
ncbi:SDR family oxidoreductase [Roseovarius sp. M141]|uniref:SDR family oxidoreductase n=1 Tax=Roseovarius sp. M141 TaxID=2583806 RepID=UPI0020CD39A1|nr:SDR family oxidoreductase [Roseovarius sp. M141]MCQ0092090.1 SDR family oxidoreductase [Roseovarius sp. M141]